MSNIGNKMTFLSADFHGKIEFGTKENGLDVRNLIDGFGHQGLFIWEILNMKPKKESNCAFCVADKD